MTPAELKEARLSLGLNIKQFAEALNTPYRTVQDWLAGKNKIPGVVEVAIRGIKREKENENVNME